MDFEIKNRTEKYQNSILDSNVMLAINLHPFSEMFITADLIPVPQTAFRTNSCIEDVGD